MVSTEIRNQQTKDEIGDPDEINPILFFDEVEELGVEAGSMIMYRRPISGSTLWGFSVWDTDFWNETFSSGWVIGVAPLSTIGTNRLGASNTTPVLTRVINPNYVWNERFLDTEFVDTSATTATWSTSGTLTFSSSSSKIAQTIPIHLNEENIYSATVSLEGTPEVLNTSVNCYLSSDGGSNWTTVNLDTLSIIETVGQDLRFKITNTDLGGGLFSTPIINSVKVSYNP